MAWVWVLIETEKNTVRARGVSGIKRDVHFKIEPDDLWGYRLLEGSDGYLKSWS